MCAKQPRTFIFDYLSKIRKDLQQDFWNSLALPRENDNLVLLTIIASLTTSKVEKSSTLFASPAGEWVRCHATETPISVQRLSACPIASQCKFSQSLRRTGFERERREQRTCGMGFQFAPTIYQEIPQNRDIWTQIFHQRW